MLECKTREVFHFRLSNRHWEVLYAVGDDVLESEICEVRTGARPPPFEWPAPPLASQTALASYLSSHPLHLEGGGGDGNGLW